MELKNKENDKEVPELLSQFEHNSDVVNMVFATELGAECIEILEGSVVINFQSLDRDMCCSLDYRFADLIYRLLKEVDLKSSIPIGDYTLTAKLSLNSFGKITDFGKLFANLKQKKNRLSICNQFLLLNTKILAINTCIKNICIETIIIWYEYK